MVAVELLVVLGLFAVVLVGGADGCAGSLVGAVGQEEDVPGQSSLDDAGARAAVRSWFVPAARGRTTGVCRPGGR